MFTVRARRIAYNENMIGWTDNASCGMALISLDPTLTFIISKMALEDWIIAVIINKDACQYAGRIRHRERAQRLLRSQVFATSDHIV